VSLFNKMFGRKNDQPTANSDEVSTASQQAGVSKVDVNKPVENPKLRELFEQWRQEKTDDILNQVFEEIVIRAHFLSVIMLSEEPESSGEGTATFKQGAVMQFPMLTTQDEKQFYPAFTDWGELAKWQSIAVPPKTLILSFDDYVHMVLEGTNVDGVMINPFGDNFLLDRSLLTHLKTQKDLNTKGVSQQVVTKETKVLLGEPKEYPTAMVAAISDYLWKRPEVQRAWLRLMIRDNEQSYLLVAEFAGDKDSLFGGIAGAARQYLNGMYIDMVPYQNGFGKDAVEGVKPFYEQK
jgi:hypothetical protein